MTPLPCELRPAWWVRALAALPLPVLYAITGTLARLASLARWRGSVVRGNLAAAFPEWDEPRLRAAMRAYYAGFGQVLAEIVKSPALSAGELRRRVTLENAEFVRGPLSRGESVLLLAAHQCNWEWLLLALATSLGHPLDAVYKPLVDAWAEREMRLIRTRFGSRLVPAQEFLADVLKRREVARAIAMVADQEPVTSERRHWVRFLNRDTAFFAGPEDIARVARLPVFFIRMRRTCRGHYAVGFEPLAEAGESLSQGALIERYARFVESQIRAAPHDWPWSHKRWKLKKPLYGKS